MATNSPKDTELSKALQLWEEEGHKRTEFTERTKIDTATTTYLFQGRRGLTREQRVKIWEAFAIEDPETALRWFVADIRDGYPEEAVAMLELRIKDRAAMQERPKALSPVDEAVEGLIKDLQERDPDTVRLALALKKWDGRQG